MKKGLFISFEGADGSGKTTIIKKVAEYLEQNNIEYVLTREPGGSLLAEKIRSLILDVDHKNISYTTEALLYAASRAQHYNDIIKPNLELGKIILCDRFLDSSLVYQGIGRGLGIEKVLSINKFAIDDVLPDKTVYLDVLPEVGLSRINACSTREVNRLDLETLDFHKKVYAGYQKIIELDTERFIVINGNNDIETVYEETLNSIKEVL